NYFKECKKVAEGAKGKVLFIDHMPQDGLKSAYGAAKVHALPSWRETPGLASLEAGLAGCNIVVTKRGSTEEYFGDLAYYCEPDDSQTIRSAVIKAYEMPRNCQLAEQILEKFTWEKAAAETLIAYQAIVR